MNLYTAFAASVEQHAAKPAIFWGEQEFRYDLLLAQARCCTEILRARYAIQPGARIGLWLKNCPEFVPAFFGVLGAGAVVVPINNFLKPEEILHILNDADIDLLITDQAMAEHLPSLQAHRPSVQAWMVEEFSTDEGRTAVLTTPHRPAQISLPGLDDLAVLIYTSGTTGRPKGAMLSHGNLWCNLDSCRQVLEAIDADRFLVLLPMFHSFMLTVGMLLPLLIGGSMVLVRSLHPPKNIIHDIYRRQATILPAVPSFFRTLIGAPLPPGLPLRICISGGAPLPVETLREFNRTMPLRLIEGYGLSEASPVVTLNPLHGPIPEGSIGLPIPGVEVSIQDELGHSLAPGETGEVCVRGGNVMKGYWKRPDETARAIRSGWLLTGDVGHRNADGFFYITDRKKDMLIVNGINVYPREIEEVIHQFPGVKEVAVVGVPDARRGEHPVAFVAAGEGTTLDEKLILQFLRQKLADYKVPKRVTFLPALPRNATGKVLKTALRQQA